MLQPEDWVPLRWPSGPAAIAAAKNKDEANVLTAWHRAEALSLIVNSPVNCLVVTWAAGTAEDAEQQSTLKPLVVEAKKQGLAVVGEIKGESLKAIEAARSAGLNGVLLDKLVPAPGLVVITATPGAEVPKASPPPIAALSDASWPHIPPRRGGTNPAAGPTGMPWVDSNGWLVQLAHAKAPGKTIWLSDSPPPDLALPDAGYSVAVADAEAYGARWIVSLQAALRRGLTAGDAGAKQTWKSVTGALDFFSRHKNWRGQIGIARLGVISDFSGGNKLMAQELLNLAARRPLPCRAIDRTNFAPESITGLRTIVWADAQMPDGGVQKLLNAFVREGGLLLAAGAAAGLAASMKPAGSHEGRFNLFASGKGRVGIAVKPWSDPFLLAADAHLLMSRKHDVLRAWNGGSSNFNYTATPDRRSAVVQIVNYTGRPVGGDMSLYVAHAYKTAVLHRLTGGQPEPLKITPTAQGVEVYLPPFAAYAAVEYGA
jgi:hypothetical protein